MQSPGPLKQVLPQQLGWHAATQGHLFHGRHDQRQGGLIEHGGNMGGDPLWQRTVHQCRGQLRRFEHRLVTDTGALTHRLQGVVVTLARARIEVDADQAQKRNQLGGAQVHPRTGCELTRKTAARAQVPSGSVAAQVACKATCEFI